MLQPIQCTNLFHSYTRTLYWSDLFVLYPEVPLELSRKWEYFPIILSGIKYVSQPSRLITSLRPYNIKNNRRIDLLSTIEICVSKYYWFVGGIAAAAVSSSFAKNSPSCFLFSQPSSIIINLYSLSYCQAPRHELCHAYGFQFLI